MKNLRSSGRDGAAVLSCSNNNLYVRYISLALALILSFATVLIYFDAFKPQDDGDIAYPLEQSITKYNPYVQQFDAFMKGQLNIDYTPTDKFLQIENPYDPEERDGVYYLYDRAYFEGKYYSYFGVAPIILVMAPYHAMFGSLPSDATMQLIFMLVFAIFMTLAVFTLGERITKRTPSPLIAFIAYAANVSSLNMLLARGRTPFYYIAATSSMAFLAAFAFFLLKGIGSDKRKSRVAYFIAAGVMYVFCLHSRVNTAFCAAFFIVPVVIFEIILKKREAAPVAVTKSGKKKRAEIKGKFAKAWEKYSCRDIIIELCALGGVVLVGLVAALLYNKARFGSLFDFGTNYQLTVAEVSKYKLDLGEFGYSVFHYFLSPLGTKGEMEALNFGYSKINSVTRYLYVDAHFGILEIPFMLLALISPIVFFDKTNKKALRYSVISALAGCFIIAWIDFCLGGVIYRYLCDFSVILAALAAIGAFAILDRIWGMSNRYVKYALTLALVAFVVISLNRTFEIMAITNGNALEMSKESLFYKLFATDIAPQ